MGRFHIPIERPEEIKPRLGKPDLHWVPGRSAYELSSFWMKAGGLPLSVRSVLEHAPEWRGAEFLEGIFEHKTNVPGKGYPSQTDLLAILKLSGGNAVLGVEGKVDETFGPRVRDWLEEAADTNRTDRLAGLCATLGLSGEACGGLYYQLLHRTCAAIYEAKRFGYKRSIMLVHSFTRPSGFSRLPAWFDEFREFSIATGMPVNKPESISPSRICEDVEVRLAWVSDMPSNPNPRGANGS